MQNYKLTLCYDGTRYRGWQKQGNTGNTIQGKLEALLTRLLDQPVEVAGCGRTDAGVHARRQVCSFRAETSMTCGEILSALREYLPEDIGAVALEPAPPRFHARLSCTEKTYAYVLWTSDAPNVFRRKTATEYRRSLDLPAMEKAAGYLLGKHDYSAFTADKPGKRSHVRTVREIRFEQAEDTLTIFFTGDGFLYKMVRILTGTLLEAGSGDRAPESVLTALESGLRSDAGPAAPPGGLFLWDVRYDSAREIHK